VTQFVKERRRANHAANFGAAAENDPQKDAKRRATNDRSIGIELESRKIGKLFTAIP
jgi:N-acetyl-anhydromuramyl-L-alanine amidase AmpD